MVTRVSRHITAKPKEHKKGNYVDHAGIGRRRMLLPGEALISARWRIVRESAEAIVG
jgi:hypothetical protein